MKFAVLLSTILSVAFAASSANASVIGYNLKLSGDVNIPTMQLSNLSDPGFEITRFTITIGRVGFDFDWVQSIVQGSVGSYSLDVGDMSNGGARTTSLDWSYTGFDPSESFQWAVDIDNGSNTNQDYRSVLFNNGVDPNSMISVYFSNGMTLSQTLPDADRVSEYNFSDRLELNSSIPEPATIAIWSVLGLGGLGLAVARRRK